MTTNGLQDESSDLRHVMILFASWAQSGNSGQMYERESVRVKIIGTISHYPDLFPAKAVGMEKKRKKPACEVQSQRLSFKRMPVNDIAG